MLVADMTDPDWEPIMKRAAAIVTNRGGRTCHAAIIARELGIPAVVGTGDATDALDGRPRGHRLLRRGRHRLRLRGAPRLHGRARPSSTDARDPGQDHDERRHARSRRSRSRSCPTAGSGWPGWSSSSTGRSASTPRRCSSLDERSTTPLRSEIDGADRGVRRPARVLRAARRRGRRDDRGRVRAGPRDRADVGLQVQRVRQPARRASLRAARGEPDDRLPRRLAVPLRGLRRTASRWSARRCATCATTWG